MLDEDERPDGTEQPERSGQPGQPGQPGQAGRAAEPGQAGQPAPVGQAGQAAEPEQPGQTGRDEERGDAPGADVGSETVGGPSAPAPPALEARERRVLGVLIEKALTVPDSYPLTVNSIVSGCNQKSNRDPVVAYDEEDVDAALSALSRRAFVMAVRPESGYATRWRHELPKALGLQVREQAIVAELLLRGPQTIGQLRTRAGRMRSFTDLEEVRESLARLEERRPALVAEIPPAPGSRAARHAHTMRRPEEMAELQERDAAAPVAAPTRPARSSGGGEREVVEELQRRVADLERRLAALEEALG